MIMEGRFHHRGKVRDSVVHHPAGSGRPVQPVEALPTHSSKTFQDAISPGGSPISQATAAKRRVQSVMTTVRQNSMCCHCLAGLKAWATVAEENDDATW